MARPRTGSAVALWKRRGGKKVKVWYGCISYFADNGKRKFERRKADNKRHAKELAQTMLREYVDGGQEIFDSADMAFAQLAEYYKDTFLVDPEYVARLDVRQPNMLASVNQMLYGQPPDKLDRGDALKWSRPTTR